MTKHVKLPEFNDQVLAEIRDEHIRVRGEEAKKLWDENKINLDYIKEAYAVKKHAVERFCRLDEGEEHERIQTPLYNSCCDKFKEMEQHGPEELKKALNDYLTANDAVMRYCAKLSREFHEKLENAQ